MFTGLVDALGEVVEATASAGLLRLTLDCPYDPHSIALGASILHDGCCLTLVSHAPSPAGGLRYQVELAAETLEKTTLARLRPGSKVNLERSLKLGDELGGHFVSGHVDGQGEVRSVLQDGAGWRLKIAPPAHIAALIAPKGSIAVDGVSLTVNEVDREGFGVLIIPHTWAVTNLARLKVGDHVNLEADMLARYVARILAVQGQG